MILYASTTPFYPGDFASSALPLLAGHFPKVWDRACADKFLGRPRELSEGEYHHIIDGLYSILEHDDDNTWEPLWILKERLVHA